MSNQANPCDPILNLPYRLVLGWNCNVEAFRMCWVSLEQKNPEQIQAEIADICRFLHDTSNLDYHLGRLAAMLLFAREKNFDLDNIPMNVLGIVVVVDTGVLETHQA